MKKKNGMWQKRGISGQRTVSRPRKSFGGYPDLIQVSLTHCTKVLCC